MTKAGNGREAARAILSAKFGIILALANLIAAGGAHQRIGLLVPAGPPAP